jgi:hypothetical protein
MTYASFLRRHLELALLAILGAWAGWALAGLELNSYFLPIFVSAFATYVPGWSFGTVAKRAVAKRDAWRFAFVTGAISVATWAVLAAGLHQLDPDFLAMLMASIPVKVQSLIHLYILAVLANRFALTFASWLAVEESNREESSGS